MTRGLDCVARSVAARRRRVEVKAAIAELTADPANGLVRRARLRGLSLTRGGVVVATVTSVVDGGLDAVLRLAADPAARADLRRLHHTLEALNATLDQPLRCLVPRPLALVEREEETWQLESLLPGSRPTGRWLAEHVADAADVIGAMHATTATTVRLVDGALERLIADSSTALATSLPDRDADAARHIGDRIRQLLVDRTAKLGRIHGDFWAGNLLVDPSTEALTGIVDWDRSASDQPLSHDLRHLMLTVTKPRTRLEIGEAVAAILDAAPGAVPREAWMPAEEHDEAEALWLLYWLRFAGTHLTRFAALASDAWWMQRNVAPVLRRYAT